MVLDDEVKKIGRFFLDAGVKLLAVKGLVDAADGALETLIIFDTEQAIKLTLHAGDYGDTLIVVDGVAQPAGVIPSMARVP